MTRRCSARYTRTPEGEQCRDSWKEKQATAARERYVAVIIRPLVTKGTIASGMSKKIISWLVAAELKWKCAAKIILQETICLSVAGTDRQEILIIRIHDGSLLY